TSTSVCSNACAGELKVLPCSGSAHPALESAGPARIVHMEASLKCFVLNCLVLVACAGCSSSDTEGTSSSDSSGASSSAGGSGGGGATSSSRGGTGDSAGTGVSSSATTGTAGSGGGIDCSSDPSVCPAGYGCACGGPGPGPGSCTCGRTCNGEGDCK